MPSSGAQMSDAQMSSSQTATPKHTQPLFFSSSYNVDFNKTRFIVNLLPILIHVAKSTLIHVAVIESANSHV